MPSIAAAHAHNVSASPNLQPTTLPTSATAQPIDSFQPSSARASSVPFLPSLDAPGAMGILRGFGVTPEKMIGGVVKATLRDVSDAQTKAMMTAHLQQMKLIDADGKWAHPKLAALAPVLLPENVSTRDMVKLVDAMVENAAENPYLSQVLASADRGDVSKLYKHVRREGAKEFPNVVAYAMVLQNLTKAMHEDYTVLEACQKVWIKGREGLDVAKLFGIFELVKLKSVEYPMNEFLRAHREGKVEPNMLRTMLSVNILEAMALDAKLGNWDNAAAGWALAKHRAGGAEDAATGAGPARFASDSDAIEFNMPLTKEWADLYSTWNMGFVSHYSYFPYVMAKLLIPEVSDYQDKPNEYIYDRALALYAHLHFSLFGRSGHGEVSVNSMNWATDELTDHFGEVNRASANDYDAKVNELSPSLMRRMVDGFKGLFS
ncbi:MAG: hypothetical protein VX210_18245 [Myxococcota bacterium]|nr:hypothetical protein [Myxococcota bacterium]